MQQAAKQEHMLFKKEITPLFSCKLKFLWDDFHQENLLTLTVRKGPLPQQRQRMAKCFNYLTVILANTEKYLVFMYFMDTIWISGVGGQKCFS